MKSIIVDWNGINFIVSVPFHLNDIMSEFSTRRWSSAHKYWVVDPSRTNLMTLGRLRDGGASFGAEAAAQLSNRLTSKPAPTNSGFPSWYRFKTRPFETQRKALNKAYGRSAFALYMDMGTGKSKVTVDLASALYVEGQIKATVILVKASLRDNWKGTDDGIKEGFLGHSPVSVSVHLPNGGDAAAVKSFRKWHGSNGPNVMPVLICSVESLSQGRAIDIIEEFIHGHEGKVLTAVDEAHHIANHKSIRSKRCHSIGAMSKYRMILTGTPIAKSPLDLYSQFMFLDPRVIGISSFFAFESRYAIKGGYVNPTTGRPTQILGYKRLEELTATVAPHVFECRKSEVIDLPPKMYEVRTLEMAPEQKSVYKQIVKSKLLELSGREVGIKSSLELMLRLHQIAGGVLALKDGDFSAFKRVIPVDQNPKIKEVIDICENGQPTIVWCSYLEEINMVVEALKAAFPDEEILEYHGGIPMAQRPEIKDKFQNGKSRILVGNTQSGGTGLTLTACEVMVFYSNTQQYVNRVQAEDRAHRIGLEHSVLYVDLVMRGTVDTTIMRSLRAKSDLAEYVRQRLADGGSVKDLVEEDAPF